MVAEHAWEDSMDAVTRDSSIKTAAFSVRAVPPKLTPSRAPALQMLLRQ